MKIGRIAFYLAIEGAEQLLYPSPLGASITQTLSQLVASDAKPVYVSLTWLFENSFGGGDRTTIGLKEKGKELLRMLSDYNIAVYLSHASYELASDIIEFRESNNFKNGLLVSHTNFRALHSIQRNVSDDVARYVAKAKGVLGLSFSRMQIGVDNHFDIPKQLEYARSLSNEVSSAMCLGGDLFHQNDLPESYRIKGGSFPPELSTAGDYSKLNLLGPDVLYNNVAMFLSQFGLINVPALP